MDDRRSKPCPKGENMNNKGQITVFLCLLMSGLLVLATAMLRVVSVQGAKSKSAMCTRTALSDIQAGYNRYIYDHYHILLFDKTGNGKGEGYVEQTMCDNLQQNLGDEFDVVDLQVTNYEMIYDTACLPLKEQISDYVKYAAIESGVNYIIDATGGKDGTLSESVYEQQFEEKEFDPTQILNKTQDDPREETGRIRGSLLLATVVPDDLTVSEHTMVYEDIVPVRDIDYFGDIFEVNSHFDDFDGMKSDMKSYGTWSDSLTQAGANVAYAGAVFNNALEQDVNDTSVMCCELEYLICGFPTDPLNLQGVVNRIVAIRMPINYIFLLSNPEKKSIIVEVATAISSVTLVPISILEYLIAGCWAYAESVAEVRCLLNGDKMPFSKNNANWITDLDNLGKTIYEGGSSDAKGLSYKDYLFILLAMNNDKIVYRMLDLMQLNACQENDKFRMIHAATGLEVNIEIDAEGQSFYIKEQRSY